MRILWRRAVLRVAVSLGAVAIASIVAEMATRTIDGYPLTPLRLAEKPMAAARDGEQWLDAERARWYVDRLPTAERVDRAWFALNPTPRRATPPDADLDRRYWAHRGHELAAVYAWNIQYLRDTLCASNRATAAAADLQAIDEFFFYEPADRSPQPPYRFLSNVTYPSGLRTNSYGWRGPDLPAAKVAGQIRVAFVGASTTVGAHGDLYSYPEYVGRWLQAWSERTHPSLTVDVINAGREGITSDSIAAIVRTELGGFAPDVIVYYEGSNEFWPNAFVAQPLLRVYRAFPRGGVMENHSALARRVLAAAHSGAEPWKPALAVAWPPDLDETAPDISDPRLPVHLSQIVANLDRMRADAASYGGTLMPSSFVWLVEPGLRLDGAGQRFIYRHLNEGLWPFSYAHLRRFADFQNRVLARYADQRGLPFNDVAAAFPRDPRLFTDAIHMTAAGEKLKAWLTFQHLVPVLERRIQAGAVAAAAHPAAVAPVARNTVSRAALLQSCAGSRSS